jgi:hypothetical protein
MGRGAQVGAGRKSGFRTGGWREDPADEEWDATRRWGPGGNKGSEPGAGAETRLRGNCGTEPRLHEFRSNSSGYHVQPRFGSGQIQPDDEK